MDRALLEPTLFHLGQRNVSRIETWRDRPRHGARRTASVTTRTPARLLVFNAPAFRTSLS